MDQVVQRMLYYKFIVMAALEAIGVPSSKVRFVQESSYQTNKEFILDQWRLCTLVPQKAVKDAWDRSYNPDMLSPMLCPGLQTLSEEHLGIDFQFGGDDQVNNPAPRDWSFYSRLTFIFLIGRHFRIRRRIPSEAWLQKACAHDEPNAPKPPRGEDVVVTSPEHQDHVPGQPRGSQQEDLRSKQRWR